MIQKQKPFDQSVDEKIFFEGSTQATTFNAPGLIRPAPSIPGIPELGAEAHQNAVLNKINNRTSTSTRN